MSSLYTVIFRVMHSIQRIYDLSKMENFEFTKESDILCDSFKYTGICSI